MLIFTPGHLVALAFWLIVWLVLIPSFYTIALAAVRKRDAGGTTTALHHPFAVIISGAWPIILAASIFIVVSRALAQAVRVDVEKR